MNALEKIRKKIDRTDQKLIKLLDKRMKYAYQIGIIKSENDLSILVKDRENEIYDLLKKTNTNHITEDELTHLYIEIIKLGRKHGKLGKQNTKKIN